MTRPTLSMIGLAVAAALSAQAQAQQADTASNTLDTVIVTGTRASGRTVLESTVPVDVLTAEDIRKAGVVNGELWQRAAGAAAVLQLPASIQLWRRRPYPRRAAARALARSSAGAGQRQAPPHLVTGQYRQQDRQGHHAGGFQFHPDQRDQAHRSAARRCRRAVRLGCGCRRHQRHPGRQPRERRTGSKLRRLQHRCRADQSPHHRWPDQLRQRQGRHAAGRRRRLLQGGPGTEESRSHQPRRLRPDSAVRRADPGQSGAQGAAQLRARRWGHQGPECLAQYQKFRSAPAASSTRSAPTTSAIPKVPITSVTQTAAPTGARSTPTATARFPKAKNRDLQIVAGARGQWGQLGLRCQPQLWPQRLHLPAAQFAQCIARPRQHHALQDRRFRLRAKPWAISI